MNVVRVVKTIGLSCIVFLANANADGKFDYERKCAICHSVGVAGAPKFGEVTDWIDRIDKGIDTLYNNAINGYIGETGVMPPKGGFTHLSDEEVKAIVDYMVASSTD